MSVSDLQPRRTDRAAFIGQTGSGKTTIARALLWERKFVVVYDGKGTIDWAEKWPDQYTLITNFKRLLKVKPSEQPRIIYRPSPSELLDYRAVNAFFRWVYERRNCTLYVDETYSVMQTGVTPPALLACITRGREVGIETWCGMQRPTLVPLVALTESENFFVFYLQWHDDRRRVEWSSGITEEQIQGLSPYYFYYSRVWSRDIFGPLMLQLDRAKGEASHEIVTAPPNAIPARILIPREESR